MYVTNAIQGLAGNIDSSTLVGVFGAGYSVVNAQKNSENRFNDYFYSSLNCLFAAKLLTDWVPIFEYTKPLMGYIIECAFTVTVSSLLIGGIFIACNLHKEKFQLMIKEAIDPLMNTIIKNYKNFIDMGAALMASIFIKNCIVYFCNYYFFNLSLINFFYVATCLAKKKKIWIDSNRRNHGEFTFDYIKNFTNAPLNKWTLLYEGEKIYREKISNIPHFKRSAMDRAALALIELRNSDARFKVTTNDYLYEIVTAEIQRELCFWVNPIKRKPPILVRNVEDLKNFQTSVENLKKFINANPLSKARLIDAGCFKYREKICKIPNPDLSDRLILKVLEARKYSIFKCLSAPLIEAIVDIFLAKEIFDFINSPCNQRNQKHDIRIPNFKDISQSLTDKEIKAFLVSKPWIEEFISFGENIYYNKLKNISLHSPMEKAVMAMIEKRKDLEFRSSTEPFIEENLGILAFKQVLLYIYPNIGDINCLNKEELQVFLTSKNIVVNEALTIARIEKVLKSKPSIDKLTSFGALIYETKLKTKTADKMTNEDKATLVIIERWKKDQYFKQCMNPYIMELICEQIALFIDPEKDKKEKDKQSSDMKPQRVTKYSAENCIKDLTPEKIKEFIASRFTKKELIYFAEKIYWQQIINIIDPSPKELAAKRVIEARIHNSTFREVTDPFVEELFDKQMRDSLDSFREQTGSWELNPEGIVGLLNKAPYSKEQLIDFSARIRPLINQPKPKTWDGALALIVANLLFGCREIYTRWGLTTLPTLNWAFDKSICDQIYSFINLEYY